MTATARTAKATIKPSVRLINRAAGLIEVGSSTEPGKAYMVNLNSGSCSCIAGQFGRMCRHQKMASAFAKVICYKIPTTSFTSLMDAF